ncbi:MAG: MBL fold metallo-hydrolase [Clostridia bacterium]|nr:MBL fold metallo-hydrolase [Clostridia bacterium]
MPQKILQNLYRIQVPLPHNPMRSVNSYIITGKGRNLIIDTGFKLAECEQEIRQGLEQLGVDLCKTDFLITHLHADHSGLVPVLASEESRVYASRREIPWLFGESRDERWSSDRVKFKRAGFSDEELTQLWRAPDRKNAPKEFDRYTPLDDGDELEYGGYLLKAVLTPGHTPAHMCFWMEREKVMFTGDHVLFDITPNITLWDEMNDTLGSYMDSLRLIDSYDPALALPGHREPGNFHGRIAELLQHHAHRLCECEAIVRENPGADIYTVAGKMSWKIRCNSWADFPDSQKWFAVGECHSHLRHLEVLGRIRIDDSEFIWRCYPKNS